MAYPQPTKTGVIPFTPPGTELQCESFYWLYGHLENGKPPLVVLHGGPGSTSVGMFSLSLLSEKYGIPVLLYDQIGCGRSTHLADRKGDETFWTFDLFIAELRNLLRAMDIRTFDLLGSSWGGMLAAKFALEQPDGLHRLVLTGAPAAMPWFAESVRESIEQLSPASRDALAQGDAGGDQQQQQQQQQQQDNPEFQTALLEFVTKFICRVNPLPSEVIDMLKAGNEDKAVYSTMYGESMLHQTGSLKTFNIVPDLPRITPSTVPGGVLVLLGRFDPTSKKAALPFTTEIKAETTAIWFEDSAHLPFIEEREKAIGAVGEFLIR